MGEGVAGFVDGSLGVVVGLDGLAVLVDGALTLAGHVEDAAEFDVGPDLGPLGVAVAAERIAEAVGGGLVVVLLEEDFADAIGGERAVLVGVEGLLVFDEGTGEVSLADELLAAKDGYFDGQVGGGFKDPGLGVDRDAAGASEGFDGVAGIRAGDVDAADLGFALGLDAELDGHAEEVEVLRDGADGAEALVVAEAVDGVLVGELRGAGAVNPLGEEGAEVGHVVADVEGGVLDVAGADALVGVLGEQAAEHLVEGFVAELPAQHVEDHGAFFEGHGLELGGEGVEAAHGG